MGVSKEAGASQEEWNSVIDAIDAFENLSQGTGLDLDIRLQGQICTVKNVYQSMRLKGIAVADHENRDGSVTTAGDELAEAIGMVRKQAEIKKDIEIFEESLFEELKYN